MGGITEKVKKFVNWIGEIIHKVLKWFMDFILKDMEKKTEVFLLKNEEKIKKIK